MEFSLEDAACGLKALLHTYSGSHFRVPAMVADMPPPNELLRRARMPCWLWPSSCLFVFVFET